MGRSDFEEEREEFMRRLSEPTPPATKFVPRHPASESAPYRSKRVLDRRSVRNIAIVVGIVALAFLVLILSDLQHL